MAGDRVAVAAGVAAVAILAGGGMAMARRSTGPAPPRPSHLELAISGDVEGLHPGAHAALEVTVANPYAFDVRLRSLEITVGDAGPDCSAPALIVGPIPTDDIVRGRAASVVDVPIAMADSAPDACQGATFPLTYTATAAKHR